jgi:hypothetical protein
MCVVPCAEGERERLLMVLVEGFVLLFSLSAQGTTRIQTLDMLPHHGVGITKLFTASFNTIYNFSKEQCMLPDDVLRIETCRSVLNALMCILDFIIL